MSSGFERLVSRLPYSTDRILGMGVSFFIREQDPSSVEFNVRVDDNDNIIGWEIKVDTEEDKVEQAKDFWVDEVQGRLE